MASVFVQISGAHLPQLDLVYGEIWGYVALSFLGQEVYREARMLSSKIVIQEILLLLSLTH